MNFDIFGSGIDIVENQRIEKILKNYGIKFLYKVFSEKEINLAREKFRYFDDDLKFNFDKKSLVNFFAKRFAGKEAFLKALGTGFSKIISLNEISILNDEFGAPFVHISELKTKIIKTFIEKKLNFDISRIKFLISLSDEKCYSISQVQICIYF